jgi:hypothetical protein
MMLALMLDPIFKDPFILSNDVKIEKTTITTRYDSETLIRLLYSTYKELNLLQNTHQILPPKNDYW